MHVNVGLYVHADLEMEEVVKSEGYALYICSILETDYCIVSLDTYAPHFKVLNIILRLFSFIAAGNQSRHT